MATQTLSCPAGATITFDTVFQVDSSNAPLTTPDPSYGAPSYAFDSTFFTENNIAGQENLISTGKLGTTTITVSETSSDPSKPVIEDVITATVGGQVAAGLQVTFTITPAA